MPSFQCQACGAAFDIPPATLAKYPGWQPKFCREHLPENPRNKGKTGRRFVSSREENLTLEEVLKKYGDGPKTGVFTDGSCIPNPGPGGWGVVWVEQDKVREQRHGHERDTTNNRMELQALIEAYRLLPAETRTTVMTDSRLCVDTITKWAPGWEKKGWKKKGGAIKNLELVQELLELYREHPNCPIKWIAAHAGSRWNEYADSLATAWVRDTL